MMAGLSSRLAERGHQVNLVTFDDGSSDRHLVDSIVTRVPLNLASTASGPISRVSQVRRRLGALERSIREISPDVVLSFCDRTNIDTLLAIGRSEIPVVVSERSDPTQQSLGWFWNRVRRHVYPRADTVIALTESSARYLRPFAANVTVIPSAVGEPGARSSRQTASLAKRIVSAGRLEYEKGFDRLIEAFAAATKDETDWRLTVYGDGSRRDELETQARSLAVADRVDFPGWVRPLDDAILDATVFCLPSRYEGFPSVILEAMSMGIPVVSVDCESGPRAIIDHGRNGLLVESSIEGLTEGLTRMIRDTKQRESLGQAGTEVVHRFGWESMVDQYEEVLYAAARASDEQANPE